ncbi:hypothetical protein CCHL11_03102 [Colletotrichum chlorophyti]|uniref:Uncharacterized protein n=1 Tax=Colletotrichum chlorophyti TaxID=708187 RepID=A0A1Q8RG75_9PEZI|nr:hypothetical protein CCHL11_03102 [Colletotrichum chlorophyti]
MTTPVHVFEDPWPEDKAQIPLETAAAKHLELVEVFLKLLPHFRQDDEGRIHEEALTFSEWRYINYMRYLYLFGESAVDLPPPWDVAIVWYCHLLSPFHFHRHLWDSNHRSYGLNHRHFPLTHLLHLYKSGKWSSSTAERKWKLWNKQRGDSPQLPYQLWKSPPWETKRKSSILSALKSSGKSTREGTEQTITMYKPVNRGWCSTSGKLDWELSQWTDVRAGRRQQYCYYNCEHPKSGTRCELKPWDTIHDLRDVLDRQVGFWKAAIRARDAQPTFLVNLGVAVENYERFIRLLERPRRKASATARAGIEMDKLYYINPGGAQASTTSSPMNRDCVPPNLSIDVLWHTHRLFPANYWVWSFTVAGRLIDYEHSSSAAVSKRLLMQTRMEWKRKYGENYPIEGAMDDLGMEEYVPDAAAAPPGHPARSRAMYVLGGKNPVKGRKRYYKGRYQVWDGVFILVDGGGGAGGDGGGGGDGGCGGDGGGGGE